MPLRICGIMAVGNVSLAPTGSRCWQALRVALNWELLTPYCCSWTGPNFMLDWLLDGSGQVGTPCERMQWEKATSFECAAPPAPGEPPEPVDEPVDDGPLPHAAASRATVAVAMMAAAVRAGRAR